MRHWWMAVGLVGGCWRDGGLPLPDPSAAPPMADVLHLAEHPELAQLKLAQSSLDQDRPPGQARLRGSFRKRSSTADVDIYEIPLPFHPKLMQVGRGDRGVGAYPAVGFRLTGPDGDVPWSAADEPNTWGWQRRALQVRVPKDSKPPRAGKMRIQLESLAEAERELNFAESGLDKRAFAFRRLETLASTFEGILLPAPSSATFTVPVPEGAVFTSMVRLVPSPQTGERSDGAIVVVERLEEDGRAVELGRTRLKAAAVHLRIPLTGAAGPDTRLRLRTLPGRSATLDYVQWVDPSVFVPKAKPRQVVLIYLDTTRADHLMPYGYERETTPALHDFARDAAIFDQARTVAPWTLPSIRAALSGDQPERWVERTSLPEHLQSLGFTTMASFSNIYLTPAFDMDRGWTRRHYELKQPAARLVDRGIAFLQEHQDRDALLLLQFMDTHLPYIEPGPYRSLWAPADYSGPMPSVSNMRRLSKNDPQFDITREYVTARYDQALRYIDDELARLFEVIDDDATVVVFADHGEELWDHGSYEHGHTFYDELLRVPLIVRSPGMDAGHRSTPVSLLDITPTVLHAVGMPAPDGLPGKSLLSLASSWADDSSFRERALGFGRPLYGEDGWGVVADEHKWFSRGGREKLYDLLADPAERAPIEQADLTAYRDSLGTSLGTTSRQVWKLKFGVPGIPEGLTVEVTHPDGIEDAWPAYEPREVGELHAPTITDGVLTYTHPNNQKMMQAMYVLPKGDVDNLKGLRIKLAREDQALDATVDVALDDDALEEERVLFNAAQDGYRVQVQAAWVPLDMGMAVPARSADVSDALRELGYIE